MNRFTRVFSRTNATLIALVFISLTALVSGCSRVAKHTVKKLVLREGAADLSGRRIPNDYIKRNGVEIIIVKSVDEIPPRGLICSGNVCTPMSEFKQAFDIRKDSLTGPQREVVDEYFKVKERVDTGELHCSPLQEVARRLGKNHKTVREHFDRAVAKTSGISYEEICEMRKALP